MPTFTLSASFYHETENLGILATAVNTMHDPSKLPFEIFDTILDDIVVPAAPEYPEYQMYPKYSDLPTTFICTDAAQQLHNSTLVSWTWHAYTVPKLYSHWHFDGCTHDLGRLGEFYCTVRSNQRLAMLVRSVYFEQWEHGELDALDSLSEDANIVWDSLFNLDKLALWKIMPLGVQPPVFPLSIHFGL